MKFRTEIVIPAYPFQISHHDRIMFIGSCFSDHIGSYFQKSGFNTLSNPFGVLFNPASIASTLHFSLQPEDFTEKYIDFFNKQWISFAHHGKFSHPDKQLFLQHINRKWEETDLFLSSADYIFITFGTAYYYYHIEKQLIVSNCHKVPEQYFEKRRLSIDEIVERFETIIQQLFTKNPSINIIFTVSPVRHLADGFHENQLSKAILHLAIERLSNQNNIFYFPAYEIVTDDLRDYRFYAQDLCHPGDQAILYMQEKIAKTFFSEETISKIKQIEKERKRKEHRPLKDY